MNDAAAIRREIEATRKRIAETAEALAYRADVKSRITEDVSERLANARAAFAGVSKSRRAGPGAVPNDAIVSQAIVADVVATDVVITDIVVADAPEAYDTGDAVISATHLVVGVNEVGELDEAAIAKPYAFPLRNVVLFAVGSLAAGLVVLLLYLTRERDEAPAPERDAA